MTVFQVIVLGLVEGLTEFLPVSSTAHLMIVTRVLQISSTNAVKTFEIAIQSGAMLAVFVTYWRSFLKIELVKRLFVALLPAIVGGFLLYQLFKTVFLAHVAMAFWALLLGGFVFLWIESWLAKRRQTPKEATTLATLSYQDAFWLGVAQVCAIIPGVSRSGATLIGGMLRRIPKPVIVEFSFLLAVPTILLATVYDLFKSRAALGETDLSALFSGSAIAFLVALGVIRWFLWFVRTGSLRWFGWYRIALGAFGLLWLFLR